jgi:hypothetical protein
MCLIKIHVLGKIYGIFFRKGTSKHAGGVRGGGGYANPPYLKKKSSVKRRTPKPRLEYSDIRDNEYLPYLGLGPGVALLVKKTNNINLFH